MIFELVSHLKTAEEREKFKKSVRAAKPVLDRLNTILDIKEQGLDQTSLGYAQFDSPSWAYRQAFDNGYRSCLRYLRTLTNIDHKKETNEQSSRPSGE